MVESAKIIASEKIVTQPREVVVDSLQTIYTQLQGGNLPSVEKAQFTAYYFAIHKAVLPKLLLGIATYEEIPQADGGRLRRAFDSVSYQLAHVYSATSEVPDTLKASLEELRLAELNQKKEKGLKGFGRLLKIGKRNELFLKKFGKILGEKFLLRRIGDNRYAVVLGKSIQMSQDDWHFAVKCIDELREAENIPLSYREDRERLEREVFSGSGAEMSAGEWLVKGCESVPKEIGDKVYVWTTMEKPSSQEEVEGSLVRQARGRNSRPRQTQNIKSSLSWVEANIFTTRILPFEGQTWNNAKRLGQLGKHDFIFLSSTNNIGPANIDGIIALMPAGFGENEKRQFQRESDERGLRIKWLTYEDVGGVDTGDFLLREVVMGKENNGQSIDALPTQNAYVGGDSFGIFGGGEFVSRMEMQEWYETVNSQTDSISITETSRLFTKYWRKIKGNYKRLVKRDKEEIEMVLPTTDGTVSQNGWRSRLGFNEGFAIALTIAKPAALVYSRVRHRQFLTSRFYRSYIKYLPQRYTPSRITKGDIPSVTVGRITGEGRCRYFNGMQRGTTDSVIYLVEKGENGERVIRTLSMPPFLQKLIHGKIINQAEAENIMQEGNPEMYITKLMLQRALDRAGKVKKRWKKRIKAARSAKSKYSQKNSNGGNIIFSVSGKVEELISTRITSLFNAERNITKILESLSEEERYLEVARSSSSLDFLSSSERQKVWFFLSRKDKRLAMALYQALRNKAEINTGRIIRQEVFTGDTIVVAPHDILPAAIVRSLRYDTNQAVLVRQAQLRYHELPEDDEGKRDEKSSPSPIVVLHVV